MAENDTLDTMSRFPRPTSHDVAARAEVHYRTLLRWVEAGVLRPVRRSARQGSPVAWPAAEVELAVLAGRLRQLGLEVSQIREVVAQVRAGGQTPVLDAGGVQLQVVVSPLAQAS